MSGRQRFAEKFALAGAVDEERGWETVRQRAEPGRTTRFSSAQRGPLAEHQAQW